MTMLLETEPIPRRRTPKRGWRGPAYEGEFPTLGWTILEWASTYLPSPADETQALRFTDEQARLFLSWYQIDPETGRFVYRRGQLETAKGWGKSPWAAVDALATFCGPVCFNGWDANGDPVGVSWGTGELPPPLVQIAAVSEDQPLALDTVVPTPFGWTTVGALNVGDDVIGADGRPVPVARDTPVLTGLGCFAVTFSDGERIVASASHSWTLERRNGHGDGVDTVTVSTEQLASDYRTKRGARRYRVAAAPFDLPPADLPVDPYLLGLWLGDGATGDSVIAIDARDEAETVAALATAMNDRERLVINHGPGNQGTVRIRNMTRAETIPSLRERLRLIGVLGAKHIPSLYLRAAQSQRQALLQGLIDSDGHVTKKGRVSFTNVNERLAYDVGELLTTLGYVWSARFDGYAHRVFFGPSDDRPVARLSRKAAHQHRGGRRSTSVYRYVTSVERVASVPVRCIGIDNADHLFLVGRRAIPTHNTENTYGVLYSMLVANDHRAAKNLRIDEGRTRLFLKGRPGSLEPVTASAGSREGQRLTHAVLDETHLWTLRNGGVRLAGVLRRNAAKMGGRTLETTNAPVLGEKSVAEQSGVDAEAGAPGILRYAPRPSIEPDPSWTDERLIGALNETYGDAYWVSRERRILEMRDPATPWDEALRFWFNVRTTGAGRAVDPRVWDELTKPQDVPAGTIIGIGFDGSISRDATVLRGCTQQGYRFLIRAWVRPKDAPSEWVVNRQDVTDTIAETFARYRVGLMLGDPPHWWDEMDAWAARFGEKIVLKFDTNQPTRMAPAVDRWRTALREGVTTHDDDPLTAEHVKFVQLRKVHLHHDSEDGRTRYVLMKGEAGHQIDAAVADVLAYEAAMTMEKPEPPADRSVHSWS